ncbi:hypothetical protein, partial [Ileibacterium valens]|uniref:hypothetical protein n=1 Tax=Ileibacterium valens TaxID=1862668 RepID=UPI00272B8182
FFFLSLARTQSSHFIHSEVTAVLVALLLRDLLLPPGLRAIQLLRAMVMEEKKHLQFLIYPISANREESPIEKVQSGF